VVQKEGCLVLVGMILSAQMTKRKPPVVDEDMEPGSLLEYFAPLQTYGLSALSFIPLRACWRSRFAR
jgi:hypothetical protein